MLKILSRFLFALFLFNLLGCTQFPISRHPASGYQNFNSRNGEIPLSELFEQDRLQRTQNLKSQSNLQSSNPNNSMSSVPVHRSFASLIQNNDIAIGMDMESVKDSWGIPDRIFETGEKHHLNQVWKYSVPVQTANDFLIQERIIHFKNGKVAGWNTQ